MSKLSGSPIHGTAHRIAVVWFNFVSIVHQALLMIEFVVAYYAGTVKHHTENDKPRMHPTG